MPRVIYAEKKVYGNPLETPILNNSNLQKVFKNSPELNKVNELKSPNFRHFVIIHGDIFYGTEYYIPKQIIFWDFDQSNFYFITIIDEKIEIRENTPESYIEVKDAKVIMKIELTIETMLKHVSQIKKIVGIKINNTFVEKFLETLMVDKGYSKNIVEMADSPTDYFEQNDEMLRKYQILEASKNMYLLYLVNILEEKKLIKTVDWKENFNEISRNLKKIFNVQKINIDSKNFKGKTAGEILYAFSKEIQKDTNKTIFCIDTDSDSYSFGIIEKELLKELIKIGEKIKVKIYQPKE